MNETITPPQPKPEIIPTEEQQLAIDTIVKWMDDPSSREFKLGGYAGTGKTTVIKSLLKSLDPKLRTTVSAFTGKAVHVLSKKHIYAQTLHSLMYDVEVLRGGGVTFHKKYKLEGDPSLVIVDESSMLSTDLYRDLSSYKKKYLFVGDPGQLEPVGDNPNLMAKPDLVLSKIHRQAEKSPIIHLANQVRLGGSVKTDLNTDELTIRNKNIMASDFTKNDQIICARNATRTSLNNKIRLFRKLPDKQITIGEKLIVLRNNLSFNVFNGLILFVDEIKLDVATHWTVNAHDETDKKYNNLPIWKKPFVEPLKKDAYIPKEWVHCDFAYVITCHKSQGSEWDSVMVIDEWMPPQVWDMKRWRYTAITRAAKKLTYCI
jgi:exodeoxyribonuclease-5